MVCKRRHVCCVGVARQVAILPGYPVDVNVRDRLEDLHRDHMRRTE